MKKLIFLFSFFSLFINILPSLHKDQKENCPEIIPNKKNQHIQDFENKIDTFKKARKKKLKYLLCAGISVLVGGGIYCSLPWLKESSKLIKNEGFLYFLTDSYHKVKKSITVKGLVIDLCKLTAVVSVYQFCNKNEFDCLLTQTRIVVKDPLIRKQEQPYIDLEKKTHNKLIKDYEKLNMDYTELKKSYEQLNTQYLLLGENHDALWRSFHEKEDINYTLNKEYQSLQAKSQLLEKKLNHLTRVDVGNETNEISANVCMKKNKSSICIAPI